MTQTQTIDGAATVERLIRVLRAVQTHARRVWLATVLLSTLGAFAAAITIALLMDHYWGLPGAVRLLMLCVVLAAPVIAFRRAFARKPAKTPEEIALLIEERYPELDNGLINSLQLAGSDHPGAESIVAAVTQEAGAALGSIHASKAVPTRDLSLATTIAAGSLAVFTVFALISGHGLRTGLARMLLPLGDTSLTRIEKVLPGNADVLLNSPVQVIATVTRRIPTQAQLVVFHPDGRRDKVAMLAPALATPGRFTAAIDRVEEDLEYQVIAGDAASARFTLNARHRPTIRKITQTVTPPDYLQGTPTQQTGGNIAAVAGSRVDIRFETAEPVREARVIVAEGKPNIVKIEPISQGGVVASAVMTRLTVAKAETYHIQLVSEQGFENEPAVYDIAPIEDRTPQVELGMAQPGGSKTAVTSEIEVDLDAKLTLALTASDDHAMREMRLERVTGGDGAIGTPATLQAWPVENKQTLRLTRNATVNVAELGLTAKSPLTIRAAAWDHRPDSPPGTSPTLTIRLRSTSSEREATPAAVSRVSLASLITKQRTNIAAGDALLAQAKPDAKTGAGPRLEDLPAITARQEDIRAEAMQIASGLAASATNPVIQKKLENLGQTLMLVAVEQLRSIAPDAAARTAGLPKALDTQRAILAALSVSEVRQEQELAERKQREISEALAELIAREQALRNDTQGAKESGKSLSARQSVLAREAVRVQALVKLQAATGAGGNADLAAQYEKVAAGFESRAIRQTMLVAAEDLSKDAIKEAVPKQDRVIADLTELLKLLRAPALAAAKEQIEETKSELAKAKEKVGKLEKLQQSITEMSKELKKNKDISDGKSMDGDLKDLVESRKNVQDVIEQMVKDMHVLPDAVASNDLLEEVSEVYEQIKQQKGSEDNPAGELAVDRDEALLQALKAMQKGMGERIGDLEMWLMDKPDSTRTKNESFDKQELGKIPLGDLPDSLEDIVGDLVKKSEKLEKDAQDSASNQAVPDGEMGWDIGDGPMPSWAAKGKSGNDRPNSNEQTGRSGSGRQGASSGEIVGDTVKSLEGGEVKARRTNEGFQAGELKEEKDSKMDVKATGGGKLAGTSSGEGFAGDAPARNELKYRDMARQAHQLKRDAETVYSKARLLRLPTGELDRAVLELDAATRRLSAGDAEGFAKAQQQVVRSLKQTQTRLAGGNVTAAPTVTPHADPNLAGATGEPLPKQYEDAVAEYMRTIAQEPR
ncbi:MAG: hypothetical protein K8S99_04205 [Planctomycetes bacterium]|nr:hypothetical protein [Planctomycetota bacterium]